MPVIGVDHVQVAIPAGGEAQAEEFWVGVLGLVRLDKPEPLASRGGRWFQAGATQVHVGVEADFRPAQKAHPALVVDDLDELVGRLATWRWDEELPHLRRGFTEDPFGNRVELIEARRPVGVPPVVGLVTLGVRDVARATAFYAALGWPVSTSSVEGEVSFLSTHGGRLGLWGTDAMSEDAGRRTDHELAINLPSEAAVDAALAAALEAGAELVTAAHATDWGGYNALIADPDGHLWELAHNPFWGLDPSGVPVIPD